MKITPSQTLQLDRATAEPKPTGAAARIRASEGTAAASPPGPDRVELSPEALAAARAVRAAGEAPPATRETVERVAEVNREASRSRPGDVTRLLRLLG